MHSAAWVALLRRIPAEQHDKLMLVTSIGQEITLYAFLDLTEDYMAIRGRLAGTTDAGRVFFIPYDQINYLGFQKEIKEAAFRAMFGLPAPSAAEARPQPVDEPVAQEMPIEELVVPPTDPLLLAEPEAGSDPPRA